jgi:hypothetical protein
MTLIAAFAFQILISAPLEHLRSKYFVPLVQQSSVSEKGNKIQSEGDDRICGHRKTK